jgi:nucleoside-diphosphate-sugar epimerase
MHVVFGTGGVGMAVVDVLVERGHQVRAVNRSGTAAVPVGVEVLGGDASDPEFATRAANGATVIYQCLNPPYHKWPEYFPPLQRSVLSAAEATGARLVTLENLYMYRHVSSRRITEETPEEPPTRKGKVRKAMADELRRAHDQGRLQAAVGRASDYFGPRGGVMSPLGDRVVPRILRGKNVSVLGDPDLPHTYSYLPDVGRSLVTLGERDEALGEVWHLPNADTVSTRELVQMMYDAAGTAGTVGRVPRPALRLVSWFNPLVKETMEMLHEFDEPYIVDSSKFSAAFGDISTPLPAAARETVDWFRGRAGA